MQPLHHSGQPGFNRGAGSAWTAKFARHCHALHFRAASVLASGNAPWLTWGVGASSMAVAAAATPSIPAPGEQPSSKPPGRPRSWQDFGHEKRRVTDTIILLNCAAFALQWLSQDLLTFWGAKVNALISAGQWWRLISPAFLHSSVFHLLVNSHALNSIGPQLEVVSGPARLAVVYAASAFTGTLASYMLTPSPSLGASGALFGCGAALAVFYWRHKEVLQQHSDNMLRNLGITVAINLGYSVLAKNVDNWGHLGGAVGGALVGWVLGPHLCRSPEGRFVDRPPISWLAYSDKTALSSGTAAASTSGTTGGLSGERKPPSRDAQKRDRERERNARKGSVSQAAAGTGVGEAATGMGGGKLPQRRGGGGLEEDEGLQGGGTQAVMGLGPGRLRGQGVGGMAVLELGSKSGVGSGESGGRQGWWLWGRGHGTRHAPTE